LIAGIARLPELADSVPLAQSRRRRALVRRL